MMIWGPKRIKELETENEELRTLLDSFSAKEERLKRFEELIKKARIEFAEITKRKDQTAHTLETLENERTKLNREIQKISYEIKQLREMKLDEENQLFTLNSAFQESGKLSYSENVDLDQLTDRKLILQKEIDAAENRRDTIKNETFELEKKLLAINQKAKEVKEVEKTLRLEIEKRKVEIKKVIDKQKLISQNEKEISLTKSSETIYETEKIAEALREESRIKESIKQLSEEEDSIKNQIIELNKQITGQKTQLESLVEDYKAGTELLSAVTNKEEELSEELNYKQETLEELNRSIQGATARLSDLNNSLDILDEEYSALSKEIDNKQLLKKNLQNQIKENEKEIKSLEGYLKELKETTTILAQLKNDIEQGSGLSAKRFTGVIKYYSTYINELYDQKIHLEKVLNQKEKDVEEKDKILEEKQSALNEIEQELFIDQDTAELFKETIEKIQRQWQQLRKIASFPGDKGFDKILQSEKNDQEIDSAIEKLSGFEETLKEMTKNSDRYFNRIIYKNTFSENERKDYDYRLNEFNNKIEQSVNELSSLHTSINKIKEEHEEHRQDINKLVSIKEKLEKDIRKYETAIDKYEKIMKKIKQEQNLIRVKRVSGDQKVEITKQEESNSESQDQVSWLKT